MTLLYTDPVFLEHDTGPHVETADRTVQLRVTKRGAAQVHRSAADRDADRSHDRPAAHLIDPGDPLYDVIGGNAAKRRQVDAYEQRLVPIATDLESLAEESYRAGRSSVLALLDAQRSLRDLRREALQASLDLQISLAELEEILGTLIR